MAKLKQGIVINDVPEEPAVPETVSESVEEKPIIQDNLQSTENTNKFPDPIRLPDDRGYLSNLTPEQLNLIAVHSQHAPGRELTDVEDLSSLVATKNDYITHLHNEVLAAQEQAFLLRKENFRLRQQTLARETSQVFSKAGMVAGMPVTMENGKKHFIVGLAPENLAPLSLNIIEEIEKLGYHVHDDGKIHRHHE